MRIGFVSRLGVIALICTALVGCNLGSSGRLKRASQKKEVVGPLEIKKESSETDLKRQNANDGGNEDKQDKKASDSGDRAPEGRGHVVRPPTDTPTKRDQDVPTRGTQNVDQSPRQSLLKEQSKPEGRQFFRNEKKNHLGKVEKASKPKEGELPDGLPDSQVLAKPEVYPKLIEAKDPADRGVGLVGLSVEQDETQSKESHSNDLLRVGDQEGGLNQAESAEIALPQPLDVPLTVTETGIEKEDFSQIESKNVLGQPQTQGDSGPDQEIQVVKEGSEIPEKVEVVTYVQPVDEQVWPTEQLSEPAQMVVSWFKNWWTQGVTGQGDKRRSVGNFKMKVFTLTKSCEERQPSKVVVAIFGGAVIPQQKKVFAQIKQGLAKVLTDPEMELPIDSYFTPLSVWKDFVARAGKVVKTTSASLKEVVESDSKQRVSWAINAALAVFLGLATDYQFLIGNEVPRKIIPPGCKRVKVPCFESYCKDQLELLGDYAHSNRVAWIRRILQPGANFVQRMVSRQSTLAANSEDSEVRIPMEPDKIKKFEESLMRVGIGTILGGVLAPVLTNTAFSVLKAFWRFPEKLYTGIARGLGSIEIPLLSPETEAAECLLVADEFSFQVLEKDLNALGYLENL
jgi:hypothetical protein